MAAASFDQMFVISKDDYKKLKDETENEERRDKVSDGISDVNKSQINHIEVTKGGTVVIDSHTGLNSAEEKKKNGESKANVESGEFIPPEEDFLGRPLKGKKLGKKTEKALREYYGSMGVDDSLWKEHYMARDKSNKNDGIEDPRPFSPDEDVPMSDVETKINRKLGKEAVKEQMQKVRRESKIQALIDAEVEKNGTFLPKKKEKYEKPEPMEVEKEEVAKQQEAMDIEEMHTFVKNRLGELKGRRSKRSLEEDSLNERTKVLKLPPKNFSPPPPTPPPRKGIKRAMEEERRKDGDAKIRFSRGVKRAQIKPVEDMPSQKPRIDNREDFSPPRRFQSKRGEKRKSRDDTNEALIPAAKPRTEFRGIKRDREDELEESSKRLRHNAPFAGRKRSAPVQEWDPPEGFVGSRPSRPPKINAVQNEDGEYPLWA